MLASERCLRTVHNHQHQHTPAARGPPLRWPRATTVTSSCTSSTATGPCSAPGLRCGNTARRVGGVVHTPSFHPTAAGHGYPAVAAGAALHPSPPSAAIVHCTNLTGSTSTSSHTTARCVHTQTSHWEDPASHASSSRPGHLCSDCSSCSTSSLHPAAVSIHSRQQKRISRRSLSQLLLSLPVALAFGQPWSNPQPAAASKLPGFADSAWEALGGGPSDLHFPEEWLGVWDVVSELVKVELPLGEDLVPNLTSVKRAQQQDLGHPQQYQVAFMLNRSQRAVYDRRFNTAALLGSYYGPSMDFSNRIRWNPDDPNVLDLSMPGGLSVRTRVTRRSETSPAPQRLETSEYLEQVFDSGTAAPRVKASQCFTKYLWRDEAAAGQGPAIVATQVVSDYLTPYDGEQRYLTAMNKPVTTYTYKMAFKRHSPADGAAANSQPTP